MSERLLLIDLSSIAHQQWHLSGNDPNPDATSLKTIERVRALASGTTSGVAICCDAPPYFRKDIDQNYKANRAKDNNAVIAHQIDLVKDTLKADGFPVWAVQGFEADDVIATAVHTAMLNGVSGRDERGPFQAVPDVTVASADKDLLQLVSDRVTVKSTHSGNDLDPDAVKEKLGVWPHQVVDYLCLVGDSSDNIKGADGIGPKRAAEILETFGNLSDAIVNAKESADTSAVTKSLRAFSDRAETVRDLIRLRTDADIPFDEIFKERVPVGELEYAQEQGPNDDAKQAIDQQTRFTDGAHQQNSNAVAPQMDRPSTQIARVPEVIDHAPVAFERQLEPRSMVEAKQVAADLFASRLFSAYGNAPAVLSTILAGRELGFQTMASLRAFHLIDGKPTLAAGAIHSLILQSGKAKYFRCTERTPTRATFETQRGDDPPMPLSFTIEEAKQAWSKDEKAWLSSGWGKNPADMLVARALTKLARLVYPDVTHGLYAPEEF